MHYNKDKKERKLVGFYIDAQLWRLIRDEADKADLSPGQWLEKLARRSLARKQKTFNLYPRHITP